MRLTYYIVFQRDRLLHLLTGKVDTNSFIAWQPESSYSRTKNSRTKNLRTNYSLPRGCDATLLPGDTHTSISATSWSWSRTPDQATGPHVSKGLGHPVFIAHPYLDVHCSSKDTCDQHNQSKEYFSSKQIS